MSSMFFVEIPDWHKKLSCGVFLFFFSWRKSLKCGFELLGFGFELLALTFVYKQALTMLACFFAHFFT